MVPGKTPPDASGSRPDSRYGKPLDVAARLSGQHLPRERRINQPVGSATISGRRWAEVLRRGSSRNRTFYGTLHLAAVRRFTLRTGCWGGLREETFPLAVPTTRSAVFQPPSSGLRILGEPGGPEAPISSREGRTVRRFSPAPRLYPFRQRPASFRKPSAGSDAATTSSHR